MKGKNNAPRAGMAAPACFATQAAKVIEGESQARAYLTRLQGQQADPQELAVIVSMLYGATLHGFCRVIEKAIGGQQT
jgi:hypothetical protein